MPALDVLRIDSNLKRMPGVRRSQAPIGRFFRGIHRRIQLLVFDNQTKTKALAHSLGISVSSATDLVAGRRHLASVSDALMLCRAYGVSPTWLFFGIGPRNMTPAETQEINAIADRQEAAVAKESPAGPGNASP